MIRRVRFPRWPEGVGSIVHRVAVHRGAGGRLYGIRPARDIRSDPELWRVLDVDGKLVADNRVSPAGGAVPARIAYRFCHQAERFGYRRFGNPRFSSAIVAAAIVAVDHARGVDRPRTPAGALALAIDRLSVLRAAAELAPAGSDSRARAVMAHHSELCRIRGGRLPVRRAG